MGADITYTFRELSRSKREQLLNKGTQINSTSVNDHKPDRLTAECLDINDKIKELASYLAEIRPSYLSNSRVSSHDESLTDNQRDEIDYETRLILQRQMGRLRALEELEKRRIENSHSASRVAKFLRDPKKEGIDTTIKLHRAGMFWYLNDLLKTVSDTHAAQQEIRLSRQLAKSKSTFHTPQNPLNTWDKKENFETNISNVAHDTPEHSKPSLELSPQQVQLLEQENSSLLEELEVTHDKVKQAEQSMYEIAELQTSLATHLSSQNTKIQSLMDDAFKTSSDVSAANEQLASARSRNRRASKIIIYSSVSLGLVLLFYDAMLG
ncbi:hypothetical protein AWJ20_3330 [Sugiyamaella lignohabitans]|uniref:t-SNARE coiled-coil homology domain-containing protein n=1 Tax=Sugiyamaella lignohabitans TaxID=796027 RepID=A0A167FTQ9_9ASCO|nr:uncharacterized protein AWJ20_3330 [Sugiyamaella lignohabitans]ANB15691.1 hypothetical protein AWJ20_3330 [Sugiyamaella lignohabitans]